MTSTAPIAKIIPFSAVDGPGSRTTVFVQGCNFNCGYCHNPETRSMCNSCGECICPANALSIQDGRVSWDESRCVWCDTCINKCSYSANPRINMMTAQQVLDRIAHQLPFIRGYTVSGGECGMYPDFLIELMTLSRQLPLTAMLDTNGHNDLDDKHLRILELCDGIMLDIKAFDAEIHREITGATNEKVLATARAAAQMGKLHELRTVCIQEKTDAEACITGMANLLGERVADVGYKIIAFRPIGVRGEYAAYPMPDESWLGELAELAVKCGYRSVRVVY